LTLGATFGSILTFFAVAQTNKKSLFFIVDAITIIATFMTIQTDFTLLIAGRILQGFALG
jgi:predicted MFS family arabinose efflux permease